MSASLQHKLFVVFRGFVLTCLGFAILGGAVAMALYLMANPRRPEHAPPAKEIPVVDTWQPERTSEPVVVTAMGSVIPANEVTLQAEVSGKIIALHPEFIEGGLILDGETVAEIDPRTYELALATSLTDVENAEADLSLEQGQQDVARHEWDMLDMKDEASALDRDLALRKPYLRQARAKLEAAKLKVRQAELDLERSSVKAPFNALIQSAGVRVGELAGSQTQLASLVGTDAYWVEVSVAVDELKWIQFSNGAAGSGSVAQVRTQEGSVREGRVLKLLGDLEEGSRLARVLIEVDDPLGLEEDQGVEVPLLLGEFVTAEIQGCRLDDVYVLPRAVVRDGGNVWMVDEESKLAIVQPDILWRGDAAVFCRGLADGLPIIVTDLSAPVEAMVLEVNGGAGGAIADGPAEQAAGAGVRTAHLGEEAR